MLNSPTQHTLKAVGGSCGWRQGGHPVLGSALFACYPVNIDGRLRKEFTPPTDQSQPLKRNIPDGQTSRSPSKGIYPIDRL
eukprot:7051759-Pyramimonas_sp.AAC.1